MKRYEFTDELTEKVDLGTLEDVNEFLEQFA